ncbi:MAG: GNAT family N-acetyltransferase [Paracoccaceae bacterium]
MPGEFVIRRADAGDLAELLALVQALTLHHGDEPMVTLDSLARDFFGTEPWYRVLVAEAAGRVVGYAALLPRARLGFGQRGLDLHHLFVAESQRGRGIGAALVAAAVDWARELGCDYMIVGTHADNPRAQAYYPRLGFGLDRSAGGVRFFRVLE